MDFLVTLFSLMMINIVLSGDNAIVIAMACKDLPEQQQKKAIIYGSGAAIVLRLILTAAAVYLLQIPYLQFVGGILLVIIAFKLLVQEKCEDNAACGAESLSKAIKTIIVADLVMSLDNVLAIAGVAQGNYVTLIIGLTLSIPLIISGSKILMSIMDRFPVLVYAGAGLIAWTSGEMMISDKMIGHAITAGVPHWFLPAVITVAVIGYGLYERHVVTRKKTELELIQRKIDKLNDSCLME